VLDLLSIGSSSESGVIHARDAVKEWMTSIDSELGDAIPTGLSDLDSMIRGFERKRLSIIAARPSIGKTSLATSIAEHVTKQRVPTAIVTLEVEGYVLAGNMVSAQSRVDSARIRSKQVGQKEWAHIAAACQEISDRPLLFVTATNTLAQIAAWVRRLRQTDDVQLVFIDYVQMLGDANSENRQQEMAAISRGMKRIAQAENVAIVALSQLSRKTEGRQDKRPQLADLAESGALERDADLVLMLYRHEFYKPGDEESAGIGEVIIAKNRGGPTGTIKLAFMKHLARWANLALGY
jgi:replicative DNA helicase